MGISKIPVPKQVILVAVTKLAGKSTGKAIVTFPNKSALLADLLEVNARHFVTDFYWLCHPEQVLRISRC